MRTLATQPFPELVANPYYANAQTIYEQVTSQTSGSQTATRNKTMRAIEVGSIYLEAGLEREAVDYLEKAVLVDTTSPRAHASLALVRLATGDTTGAKQALAEAIKYGKSHPMALVAQGVLLVQLGDFANARSYLAQAAQSADTQAVEIARGYLNTEGKDQVTEAKKYLEEAKEQPLRKRRAIQALQKALLENPDNRQARELLQQIS
jgi:Tfp pilus assembly protein PilF